MAHLAGRSVLASPSLTHTAGFMGISWHQAKSTGLGMENSSLESYFCHLGGDIGLFHFSLCASSS